MFVDPSAFNLTTRAPTAMMAAGPGYEYLVYKPEYPSLVYSQRQTIYIERGDEALYGVDNRYLEAMRWIKRVSWNNDSKAAQKYTYTVTSSLTITSGEEINQGFNVGASYEGMSIGYEYGTKTFKNTETTKSSSVTVEVNVPPESEVILYQRQYEFKDETTFINDAWHEEWNVGPWGGYDPLTTKTSTTAISSEDYFTATKRLINEVGTMSVDTVAKADIAPSTRKRENVTQRAKDTIAKFNI